MAASRELRATYRLQLTPQFGFAAARQLIGYLADLGISHLYLSPSLQARDGSTHGYDVVDPARLSDALGGRSAFAALAADAHEHGMGVVLDVVPNHMAASDENPFWKDPGLRERFFDLDPVTGRHRRFFDIDDLAAIRIEDDEVFEATMSFTLSLVAEGLVDGLRVDHPDGLLDPAGYLRRLRTGGANRVWVEKILDPGEPLRDWPVSGTVGYEFLNDVCALFVDPAAEPTLTSLWEEISGDGRPFGELALEAKREQLSGTLAPELERLGRELGDGTLAAAGGLDGLAAALSSLPVYRTYVEPWAGRVEPADRAALRGVEPAFREPLLLERPAPERFVTRFQQTTPAVMAKGVEDTAFYRHARLLALNDVGGDPGRFGLAAEEFHAANAERLRRFPEALLTTNTHDAKRSADMRARIGAISEHAAEWAALVRGWTGPDGVCTRLAAGPDGPPDRVEQLFILQTLAGCAPIESDRLDAYLEKALREAKRHSNWVTPNPDWEAAVQRFWRALVRDEEFLSGFEPMRERLVADGARAALGQLVLKLTCPGVPDIYQGDELETIALVDPDNRREVDFARRRALLAEVLAGGGALPRPEARKLAIIHALLALRARRPEALGPGAAYTPLKAPGGVLAFRRGDAVVVAVAIRRENELADVPLAFAHEGDWRDVLPGEPSAVVLERMRPSGAGTAAAR